MKIGIVAPGGFDRSGKEKVIPVFLSLIERLARRHEVHVFTLYQSARPEDYPLLGAAVHNIGQDGRGSRRIMRALGAIRREHRRQPFDVLHGLWANESGLIAALAGKRLGVRSVVSVGGGELVGIPDIGYGAQLGSKGRMVVSLTLRWARAVTAATRYVLLPLQQRRPDAQILTLGVDTDRFEPPTFPPDGPPYRLIHVASLNRVKDQRTLLRAFRQVCAAEPDTRLDIYGTDTLDGEMQRLALELGIADAVTFHGFAPSEEIAQALRRSHLYVHSSHHEAGPVSVLEAAACGLPAVGTAVGHIDDLAPDAAVAVPVSDHRALAWAVTELLQDEPSRIALGKEALNFARLHDADWTAARFEDLYAGAVTQPVRRAAVIA
jgi:glycosyltransferase involved in cell wall biosynthesis